MVAKARLSTEFLDATNLTTSLEKGTKKAKGFVHFSNDVVRFMTSNNSVLCHPTKGTSLITVIPFVVLSYQRLKTWSKSQ